MRHGIILYLFLLPFAGFGQTSPDTYWIQFTDKDGTPYSLDQPEAFLSPRAIQRRLVQGIALDELDLPVDPAYVQAVLALGEVQLQHKSKWFNAITIRTSDPDIMQAVSELPFVQQVRQTRSTVTQGDVPDKFPLTPSERDLQYGPSLIQVSMMNVHLLHELSLGEGMLIGVLDSGFEGVDINPVFGPLRDRDGIVHVRDMVQPGGNVYAEHWHGRSVLSCMAGIFPDHLIGTAPGADYVLVRTEAVGSEYIVEEDNWVAGAELCDSLGCDILNTSLGYTRFDDPSQDHAYADLDGLTTRISIASGIASSKGMIPVSSAGNSGENDWYYISAPADAHDILAVGAVGAEAQPAPFSSHGPSADGRVKPDVSAMGWGTIGLNVAGDYIDGINGTSFAAPLVAGAVACLWKLHPERTAADIMQAVRASASHYSAPGDQLGFGIPDFMAAHDLLLLSIGVDEESDQALLPYPLPFQDRLQIRTSMTGLLHVSLVDIAGRTALARRSLHVQQGTITLQDLGSLADGPYLLVLENGGQREAMRVVKSSGIR